MIIFQLFIHVLLMRLLGGCPILDNCWQGAIWCVCVLVSILTSARRTNSEIIMTAGCDQEKMIAVQIGMFGNLVIFTCSTLLSLKTKSCQSYHLLHQSWMICFGLGVSLYDRIMLFFTPSHVTSEAVLCCFHFFLEIEK